MQVFNNSGIQPMRFERKRHIVDDNRPLQNQGVSRIPSIRVGVPTDEETRISPNKSPLESPGYVGGLKNLLHRFL